MDIRTGEVDGRGIAESSAPELTFAWLHDRVRDYRKDSKPSAGGLERWSFWFGLAMAGVGLLSTTLTPWLPRGSFCG